MSRTLPDRLIREEVRYPYLDQTLVEFLLSVPRSQIIRPGERRWLMRRALAALVPAEVLLRRTKGTAARRPLLAVANDWGALEKLSQSSFIGTRGYINQLQFCKALIAAKNGNAPHLVWLLQTLSLEFWLKSAVHLNLVRAPVKMGFMKPSAQAFDTVKQPAETG